MFVEFNKYFGPDKELPINIPSTLVDHLSKKTPAGTKYELQKDGALVLVGDNLEMILGGVKPNFTPEQKSILGDDYTQEELCDYLYNSQEKLSVSEVEPGFILVNNERYPIDQVVIYPAKPIEYTSGKLFIIPEPFPGPFNVSFGGFDYDKVIPVQRVANKSIHTQKYVSVENSPLSVSYSIDTKTQIFSFSISYNLNYAESIKDMVETIMIYAAFIQGKGKINGSKISDLPRESENIKDVYKAGMFWQKALKVEETLNVQFSVPHQIPDESELLMIEQLYQNLVMHNPVKVNGKYIESIDGSYSEADMAGLQESIGKPTYFEYLTYFDLNLFNVQRRLPCLLGVVNAVVSRYEKIDEETLRVFFKNESQDKKAFSSVLCFISLDEIEKYRSQDNTSRFDPFRNAKSSKEYFDEFIDDKKD